jgi:hypothetical protein
LLQEIDSSSAVAKEHTASPRKIVQ